MECTINDINLSFDKDNRLRSTIGRVSGWSVDKAIMLAAQLQTEGFKSFLKENLLPTDIIKDTEVDINNIKDEDYVNIKQNKFGSLLNAYYLKTYHSVNNSKTNRGAGKLMGFSSSNAKGVAKNYVADLVIDKYQENLNKPRESRKDNAQIVREVIDEIDKAFLKRADEFANNIISTNKYNNAAKEYARKFMDVTSRTDVIKQEANNLYNDIQSTVAQINEMNKRKLTKGEREAYDALKQNYEEANTRHKNLTKAFYQLKRDRAIMAMNLINLYSSNIDAALSERNKNFLNLYLQVKGNPNQFFFEVFHTKKMTNLVKEYDKLGDINEYEEADEDNDDIITDKFNDQSTNETSKSWEDNLYKNFNQSISTKMRFILARVPKLAAPFNPTETEPNYNTENELGVRTYYDPSYLILQIHTFADFSSAEAMINSLDAKSKEIKALYGLGEFVNKMRQDREFANYCYANFAKPLVNKVMVTINAVNAENGIEFDYSNPNAFNEVKLGFDMLNKLRATYNTNYDINDSKTLIALDKQLRSKRVESVREQFQEILLKYFPNFDSTAISNIFKLNNATDIVVGLIRNLNIVVQESGNIKKRINYEYDAINREYNNAVREWNDKYAQAAQNPANKDKIPNYPTRREFNPILRDLTPTINKAVLSFAHTISQYNESHARINTANAAGNTASDIIKNNFVTRFFDMILAEDDGDSKAGLKAFGRYLMQGCEDGRLNQYSNNPLFFGLKDANGQIVRGYEGMFRREGDSAVPNPNAKQILKYALFDGVRNNNTGVGTVYDKMSKIDFFITQYIAFGNSLAEHTVESGNTKEVNGRPTAVYPMRIGSDAPKIFMIRAPRYSMREANLALYNHFLNELTMFIQGVNNLFEIDEAGNYVTKRNINGLISRAYFDEREADKIKNAGGTDFTKAIVKQVEREIDGKKVKRLELVGNMFKFLRLFDVVNNSFGANIEQALSLYGPDNEAKPALFVDNSDGRLRINRAYINRSNSFIKFNAETNRFELSLDDAQRAYFLREVNKWSNDFLASARNEIGDYIEALKEQGIPYTDASLDEFLLNSIVMNMNYDDMFEGDFKYYNSARDFLKRTKETQAGGDAYDNVSMVDSTNEITESNWNGQPAVISIKQSKGSNASAYTVPTFNGKTIVDKPMVARNGWRAVTIRNVVRPADEAQLLQDTLEKQFIKEGMDKERAHNRAVKIAAGYWANTKANDAQSYITLEEFIRRRDADGTLNEYQDILAQLLDPNVSASDINLDEINARIQVQKNFYYDKVYDPDTRQFIPRQIKNAEFVLIPKLLPEGSELIKVYNWMRANDIGQLNTAETDKAAKKNILDIWIDAKDEEGNSIIKFIDPNTNSNFDNSYIQNYKYKYLYKQQDVPQHMLNEQNKLGAQISKKILDNVSTAPKEVQTWADKYQEAYTENIRQDFINFITTMGWELDSNRKLVNSEYATTDAEGNPLDANTIELNRTVLNLDRYYARARQEAIRLGMDSNFMEYLTTDEFGRPLMPNSMNNVQQKLESVGQALFNRAITRQVLPGWHAAQITGVGYSHRLKFDAKTGIMEVYLPRWSKLIPKDYDISKLETEGLDIHLGYRIPTEGKQSISVLKVVGFAPDCLGSTIIVPDAWITQTGSDFDVDSIYGICYETYGEIDNKGELTVRKITFNEKTHGLSNELAEKIDNIDDKIADTKKRLDDLISKVDYRIKRLYKDSKKNPTITNLTNFVHRVSTNSPVEGNDDINAAIETAVELANNLYLKDISENAERRARNNFILDRMIKIMNDDSSREEQYGRSQFEDIAGEDHSANTVIDRISGTTSKLISPYNPLTQLDYFDDAMGGAGLKAISVNWDTFVSKSNRVHGVLSDNDAIDVVLNLDGLSAKGSAITYNEQDINDAFGDTVKPFDAKQDRVSNYDDGSIKAKFTIQMKQLYGDEKRDDINATNTLDAIRLGERTATTRYTKDGNIDYYRQMHVGDIVKLTGTNGYAYVRIIKALRKLPKNTSAEEWSKKEGWNIKHFNKVVKPEIDKGEAYQIEYEYIAPASSNIEIQSEIDRIGEDNVKTTINTLNSNNNELSEDEKKVITEKLGRRPRILIASQATDPVFHAKQIKQMVETELAKPAEQRNFHMMYLITKHDGLPFKELAQLKIPKFIHFSITSLGATKYEPGVMKMDDLLDRIETFIKDGTINPRLVTIRIDPIVPGVTKKEDIRHIMERSKAIGIDQFKFSLMDSYGSYEDRFIVQKMRELGYPWETYYDTTVDKNNNQIVDFNPKQEFINDFYSYMDNLAEEFGVKVWTCGENPKGIKLKNVRTNIGCVNVDAMNKAMGTTDISYVRGHQRKECSCYGNKTDACNYGASCASSCVYCYAKHNGNAVMQYYNTDGTLKDNDFTRTVKKEPIKNKTFFVKGVGDEIYNYHLYTGTDYKDNYTKGGDSIFYEISKEFGIKTTGYNPKRLDRLTKEQRDEIEKAYIRAANDLGRPFIPIGGRGAGFVRRDYLQAKSGDAVFAIGNIVYPGQRNKDGYTVRAKNPSVDGGTGYAVQMAMHMNKPIHVFNPYKQQWYKYDYSKKDFIKESIPQLTPKFTGIGTEDVDKNESVKKAIRDLFIATRDGFYKKDNNVKDLFDNYDTNKHQVVVKLNKFGWSNNNKGVTGNYITTSTAETTAHHLDAIKSGSIPGVNPYTFGVYKLITCIGLDHEFSVGFIRQPIIQRLVSNYNLTQSIYFGGANDPINMTFADIASDLGLTINDRRGNPEPINKNTYIGAVINALKTNPKFIIAFNNIFGVDISEMENNDILNLKFPLRKDYIFQRIETAGKNGTNKINVQDATAYNQAAVDFSMLIMFRQMNNTVFRLNNIIQFSAVDKIGAKPSIHETRRIQENIDKYRTDGTITVGDKSWADAVFPKDNNGNIDVDASVNKPIAAAYAYATLPSLQVGKQVFITENDDYIEAERYTERIIGRRLNEQEHKEWRRYAMLYMYNSIKKLLAPLCVDEQGRVMYFRDETSETDIELKTAELWNPERSRIVGYGIVDESDFSVADINKPTDAEIAAYTKLTPAQKVLFVQRNFPDNQGIFNYLKVTMISNANIRRQGISRQYISYDDQVDSIEDLFLFFENSFDNKNPLVKLAMVDLIKYAFIAEGFNFRSGYITKIIINSSLYNDFNQGGMDIINSTDINDHTNDGIVNRLRTLPNEFETTNFVELYVRSHPDIIKTSRINSLNSREGRIFRAGIRADGLIHLDNTIQEGTNQSLIKRLKVKKNVDGYVRIDFPTNGTNRATALFYVAGANPIYKTDKDGSLLIENGEYVIADYQDYFLIPLNQLELYECYTNSYNTNYNKFNDIEYYNALVEELERATAAYRFDPKNNPNPNSKYKPIKAPVGKYVPSTGNLEEAMVNPEALSSMYFSADNFIRGGVRMLIDDIRNNYLTRVAEGNPNAIYILNNNSIIGRYIPVGKYATQTITDNNGQPYSLTIAHVPMKAGVRQTLKRYIDNRTNPTGKEADELQFIINRLRETNTSSIAANIYRVAIAKQPKETIDNNIRKAATIEIDDVEADTVDRAGVDAGLARRGIEIDSTSSAIIRQITYDARKNNSAIANEFVRNIERRGVNRNYRSSLREHRANIYTAAARYYQSAANAILNNIDRYKIGDDYYDLSTPKAYEALAEFTEEFGNVARILLDALTFGNRIDTIFNLDIATEDKETKDAIENIRRTINKVRTNTKIQRALSNIINVYFKKYSTNPLIVDGLMQLRDTFGDTDNMIKYIFDAAESHSPEVQVILKQVYTSFSKAEMFETQHNLKEWRDDIAKIDAMTESLDMSKVIDFNSWRLRQDYNEDYLKERDRVLNEYNEAKRNRFDSVEAYGNYLRKQLARDKFNYEHKEQPIVAEYYKEDIENRERALERGGESYIKYRMLSAQLYELKRTVDENNEEEMNQVTNIKAQMNALKSITDGVGSEKVPHLKQAAEAINDYIAKRREILEKYFDSKEYDGFQETYSRYNSFIKSYDNKHSEESLATKLENPEYSEAYNWIKTNGHIGYTKEANDKIAEAFKKIVGRTTSMSARTRMRLKNINGAIDDTGIINPTVLTDEQIDLIRQEEESELASKYANGEGEIILIKEVPKNTPVTLINKKIIKYKYNSEKMRVIGRINEILSKAVNHDNGHIDIATLFNNDYVTDAEREELGRLYNQLYNFNEAEDKLAGKAFTYEINKEAYNDAMTYYHTHLERTKQGRQFLNIFTFVSAAGQLKPNRFIYGFKAYKDEYIDQEKTAALNFIKDNVEFVPSEYYYQAMKEASNNGTYEEWLNRNHIYNPFSHKYEPLKIWTIMQAKPDSELAKQTEYIPSFDNMERSVKKEYINDRYKEFGTNYKRGDSRFDSNVNRNAKEQAMYDLVQRTLTKYASTYQSKRFVGQGYLPREREVQVNGKWMATQLAALFGMSWHSNAESDSFSETVDYSHDRDADMDMLNFLKGKGSKQYKHIPIRADYKTDEEYEADVAKVREENRKIAEENRKIDAGLVSKNFRKVMEDFVYNATIFNSRQAAKPYLYLLLEDLQRNDAYKLKAGWNRHLIRDYDRSTSDDPQYRMTRQRNTYDLIHNLARRLLFNQYHEKSTMRNVANFLQNLTSAKFMVFNLYGGIANVTTGSVNIAMEQFANDYFGVNDFRKAQGKYLSNSAAILASAFTDKAPNLEAALCKQFKVVDFDQVLQFGATSDNLDAKMRKVRDFLYSFQSMGEHYMQNSVMFAMLKSNRIYTDAQGNVRIGDFKDFTTGIEVAALRDVLASRPDLLMNFQMYIDSIRNYDVEKRLELSMGRTSIVRSFLYTLRDNIDPAINSSYEKIATEFNARRKDMMKEARTQFNENPTIESIYEYKDGQAVVKREVIEKLKPQLGEDAEGKLETMLAELREKVKAVNKKIHGIYDKNGAALLENTWWGSILMQYHKHLPMGILKRYRRRGYYSEFRGSMERGTYQSIIDFLGTEFTNFKNRRNRKVKDGTNIALASLQVVFESALNTIHHLKLNWGNLDNWEQANIRRNLAEVGGVLAACLLVIALYGLSDDDDINDDRFKASCLYLADRLYSETTMYGPQGLVSEYNTAKNNPLASMSIVNDLVKAMTLTSQYLLDPNYNPEYQTGRYAGENKLEVLLKRNISGYRSYDRILMINKNNNYYKVGESQIGINIAKNFGELLNE